MVNSRALTGAGVALVMLAECAYNNGVWPGDSTRTVETSGVENVILTQIGRTRLERDGVPEDEALCYQDRFIDTDEGLGLIPAMNSEGLDCQVANAYHKIFNPDQVLELHRGGFGPSFVNEMLELFYGGWLEDQYAVDREGNVLDDESPFYVADVWWGHVLFPVSPTRNLGKPYEFLFRVLQAGVTKELLASYEGEASVKHKSGMWMDGVGPGLYNSFNESFRVHWGIIYEHNDVVSFMTSIPAEIANAYDPEVFASPYLVNILYTELELMPNDVNGMGSWPIGKFPGFVENQVPKEMAAHFAGSEYTADNVVTMHLEGITEEQVERFRSLNERFDVSIDIDDAIDMITSCLPYETIEGTLESFEEFLSSFKPGTTMRILLEQIIR